MAIDLAEKREMDVRCPKLPPARRGADTLFYKYYAGYSTGFVEDLLAALDLGADATIGDPWNGSGTTTYVAKAHGLGARGFDLSPALVVLAKARLVDLDVLKSAEALKDDLLEHVTGHLPGLEEGEPFCAWFEDQTAQKLRALEKSVYKLLISGKEYEPLGSAKSLSHVSRLAALFYAALFRTIRACLTSFRTTNPTWIKVPRREDQLVAFSASEIHGFFESSLESLLEYLAASTSSPSETSDDVGIEVADSRNLPLEDSSLSAAITSPPYCTRIDYAIATLPELAVLGHHPKSEELRALRDSMLGTPTLYKEDGEVEDEWGSTCLAFLDEVTNHESRASSTYYRRYFAQYFSTLHASLVELGRCLAAQAPCAIVVQDSYYKEIHNDLPRVIVEMGDSIGWRLSHRRNYSMPVTKAAVNRGSHAYREDFSAVEALLVFET